ncbi:MAG: hypothetical protein Fur0044_11400 [Anaerolineae bacterium]|nr:nucleotidyltransferase domain-containing protein [Anaerolineales bacterium]MCQ3977889.1 hypothetical protein [Anaerolineae bacterium]
MVDKAQVKLERQQRATEITSLLKKCAPEVLEKYPVEMAYLHGSVARGCPLPTSDVDIALVLAEVPSPYDRLTLELKIQAALEDACRLSNLDVRSINQAPVMVQGQIIQEGVLLYRRDKDQQIAFEILTRKKYFDYRPIAMRMEQTFFDHIRQQGLSRGQAKNTRLNSE